MPSRPSASGLGSLVARRPRLTLAIALVLGFLAARLLEGIPPPARRLAATPVVRAVLEDPGSPRLGAADPEVVVVVFTDYQCGVCKRTDGALLRLMAADPGVQVVFKDWPVFGERSREAARAALAAHRQGGYLAFHAALMQARGPLDAAALERIGRAAGLDWERLAADRAADAAALEAQIRRHELQAFSLGLEGTPGYLVGPYLIQGGLSDRDLAQAVARARRDGPL